MYHLLILLVATLAPLSHAVALPAQPLPQPGITPLNFNTDVNPGDLKAFAATQNLTNPAAGGDNRLLPCLSLGCVQCAAIVFFCAGSCVFAELDLPVCIDCIVGEGENPALEQKCIQCVVRDCMHGAAEPSPGTTTPQVSGGSSEGSGVTA